ASGQEVIIIEYKRSSASVQGPQKGVADGIYFQLPLYLIAAKNFLKNKKICGAFSYVFREGKRRKGVLTKQILGRNSLITNEEMEDLLEMTIVKVQEKLNGIVDGNFFVKPFDFKRCVPNSCEFFDLCRIDPKSFRF
ncbi:MAG: PD-(D/E)XK nuclease family protein, partial [Candidatus Marinimicrobia bacterium]|nr:PD-(D/E)XK nuclease family protein [Candidatus Neomarinimicrobiota bacterium]